MSLDPTDCLPHQAGPNTPQRSMPCAGEIHPVSPLSLAYVSPFHLPRMQRGEVVPRPRVRPILLSEILTYA